MAATAATRSSGPAHVATVSFLASRAVPLGGFWVALAGGVALARVGEQRGARTGYAASVASVLETVAIMGPARFGVPLTQALTAPLLGVLETRGWRPSAQALACGTIRLLHNAATVAFFIWVIAGGLDAYAGTYDSVTSRVGIEIDSGDALLLTVVSVLAWAVFASVVQVAVYRRGLRRWEGEQAAGRWEPVEVAQPEGGPPRFDPRAVTVAAAVAFALLLASTEWPLLVASGAFLALAWTASRPDRRAVPTGLVLGAALAGGAFVFSLGGGLGLEVALRRGLRAALLVSVATWLRAAARAEGLREVARRSLGRVRAVDAAQVLDEIGSEGRLLASGRSLVDALDGVRRRPLPLLDAVLDWVAREARRFRPSRPRRRSGLRLRAIDVLLVAGAVAPAAALV